MPPIGGNIIIGFRILKGLVLDLRIRIQVPGGFTAISAHYPAGEFRNWCNTARPSGLKDEKGWLDSIRKVAAACNSFDEKQIQRTVARSIEGRQPLF